MTFDEALDQVRELLRTRRRVTYQALKVRFGLDDAVVAGLKAELIKAERVAADEDGEVLVWIGEGAEGKTAKRRNGETAKRRRGKKKVASSQLSVASSPQLLDASRSALHVPRAEAERRQLTVKFIDLVGSTTLSQELDPEDYYARVVAYQAACQHIIARYEGHVAQYLGDGILVYHGYPVAHEEDAVRAVRSGLEILAAVSALPFTPPLQVRIGIHTGLVMVGDIGAGERTERLALGGTPNIAARVQGKAEPNTVVISRDTYRLVQGYFSCEELGAHDLKGVSQPLMLYQVQGEGEAESRFDVSVQKGLTPLVGREEELELLQRRWERAKAREGQVVLVSGEAGIGKSRLVQVLRERIKDDPHFSAVFRCSPLYQHSALYPVVERLQRVLQFAKEDTTETKLTKLTQALTPIGMATAEPLALFAALLSLSLPADHPPLQLSPQKQKEKTLHALLHWLRQSAGALPIRLEVEDLQWADPTTLELLGLLIDQAPSFGILALLTFRPEFSPPWPHQAYLLPLPVSRLPQRQIQDMVQHVAGKALPADVLQQLISKSDGVPLYIEEMTKNLLESGLLKEVNGHYEATGPLPQVAIPTTLHDSFASRLDRLAPVRELAQIGAVLGREFSYELIQAVARLDDAILQAGLSQLGMAEILYQRGIPPQATYSFKHALLQDTAYESLVKSKRQQLHGQTALVLVQQFPETVTTHPELVAHHYTAATLIEQAIPYWQQAGQRASQRSANVEAIAHLNNGLALLKTLPDSPEHARQELALQTTLGPVLVATKGYTLPEVEHTYTRALELCRRMGETPQLFPALRGLQVFYFIRADYKTARELAEQLLTLAQRVRDPGLLVGAHLALGQTLDFLGELTSAREHLEQGMALHDPQQYRSLGWAGGHPAVQCLTYEAYTLWLLGYPHQALQRSHEALALAQELSHPFSLAVALHFAALLHNSRREWQAAQERAEALVALSTEQGFPFWVAWGTMHRGWALAGRGQVEDGIAQIRQGLATYQATGAELARPYWLTLLAEAYGKVGQPEAGLQQTTEVLALMARTEERQQEAELHRLKGELTLHQFNVQGSTCKVENPHSAFRNPQSEAEACFQQALEVARRQDAKSLELRAVMSLVRLRQQQAAEDGPHTTHHETHAKLAEAHQMLSEVYAWFTEGFDTQDLIDAKVLLDSLGASVQRQNGVNE